MIPLPMVIMGCDYLHKLLEIELFVPECSVNGHLVLKGSRSISGVGRDDDRILRI